MVHKVAAHAPLGPISAKALVHAKKPVLAKAPVHVTHVPAHAKVPSHVT